MTSVLAVSTAVVTAVIAAGASLTGALITAILGQRIKRANDEHLVKLTAELEESHEERKAQRDYRYEAVKRLYTDLQPLLFQLSELCESGYRHTRGLARTARRGNLGAGEASWFKDEYYLLSTVHRLLVPVAVVHLIQRRLTLVDLSVDTEVHQQYRFARALAGTWNSGFDLAGKEPVLEYRPHDEVLPDQVREKPYVYGLQHLYAGQIDQIVDCLVVRDPDGHLRYRTYGEFEKEYRSREVGEVLAPAVQLFSTFEPRTHPVLWRMLVAQAHLYSAIARTFSTDAGVIVSPTSAIPPDERAKFDWREPGAKETDEEAVDAPFRAVEAYLSEVVPQIRPVNSSPSRPPGAGP